MAYARLAQSPQQFIPSCFKGIRLETGVNCHQNAVRTDVHQSDDLCYHSCEIQYSIVGMRLNQHVTKCDRVICTRTMLVS